jgi:coproporphyrinogen III oxidase
VITKEYISDYLKQLQDNICAAIESTDGAGVFKEDAWQHHSGGGGRTRVIAKGNIIEKGGVNFSAVSGKTSEALQKQLKITSELEFFATGVSIVMHPVNPHVPIIHMNVRYFELSDGTCWFGGGIDLTPHYVVKDQATWFHQQLKSACDVHHPEFYEKFKIWADNYFYIPHRDETRGIGGIFYDYLKPDTVLTHTQSAFSKEQLFNFMKGVGETFAPTYTHLMKINGEKPFSEREKEWQYIRRGRYAEFNLVWDRGTKFGLETNGRTESILMSLPPHAEWQYDYQTVPGSAESFTLSNLIKGIDWINR